VYGYEKLAIRLWFIFGLDAWRFVLGRGDGEWTFDQIF
jgi:hypothetical protein